MKHIAHICTDFPDKFGIPRQSGILHMLESRIVFEKEYRSPEAIRGIDNWSHLWLIWEFSEAIRDGFSPTVRPPRLGGNTRVGVFASRAPFRPNPIGLSCVKLVRVEKTPTEGHVLVVTGADMVNGTPIYDIKPYLPYADSVEGASGGFAEEVYGAKLSVDFPKALLERLPENKRAAAKILLADDPRPAVRATDSERVFGFRFAGFEIKFTVANGVLTVVSAEAL